MNGKPDKTTIFAIIVVIIIMAITVSCSISDDSGSSWDDLSDVEKENAEWAYYAQQAIDDYN